MPFPSLLRRQEPGLKHSFSCLSMLAFAKMLKQLKLNFRQAALKGILQKISACVFYEDCGFHAYDYAVSRRAYLCRYKPP